MANLFKVTYQQFIADDNAALEENGPKSWQPQDTELMPEPRCTVVFRRLLAIAQRTQQTQVRNVRMWESDVPVPVFTDVSTTHLP